MARAKLVLSLEAIMKGITEAKIIADSQNKSNNSSCPQVISKSVAIMPSHGPNCLL